MSTRRVEIVDGDAIHDVSRMQAVEVAAGTAPARGFSVPRPRVFLKQASVTVHCVFARPTTHRQHRQLFLARRVSVSP